MARSEKRGRENRELERRGLERRDLWVLRVLRVLIVLRMFVSEMQRRRLGKAAVAPPVVSVRLITSVANRLAGEPRVRPARFCF